MRVLGKFDEDHPRWALSDLARATGMPKTTVHRIVRELVSFGVLSRVGNDYAVGLKLLELGGVTVHARLRDAAAPFLQHLRDVTGETVHLAVLDGLDVVYLEKLVGRRPMPMPSRIGGRCPATSTAVGKALLACSPAAALEQALRTRMRPATCNTITDPARLRAELMATARRRLAIDNQEAQIGLVCAAVPIYASRGMPVAAVSVSGPAQGMQIDRVAQFLSAMGGAIAKALPTDLVRVL